MDHIAIDLGGRESQICVRAQDGTIIEERRCATRALEEYLAERETGRVVMETSAEAFAIADAARLHGHDVRVVPGLLVRQLGIGHRSIKNDRQDARLLSEVSVRLENLPSVHVPSSLSRQRKSNCGMREALVSARTQMINTLRGWLRSNALPRPRSGVAETFPQRVREIVLLDDLPRYVDRQLETVEHLNAQIKEADEELLELAENDEECRRLMTVPGVGPVTALRFAAVVDEVGRFDTAHKVESYLGLTPGENSSGDRERRTGITKAGSPAMRRTLIQAAWAARRTRALNPMVEWSFEIEKRRGKRIAIIALARKMVGIMFALLRDGTTYNPKQGAAT